MWQFPLAYERLDSACLWYSSRTNAAFQRCLGWKVAVRGFGVKGGEGGMLLDGYAIREEGNYEVMG